MVSRTERESAFSPIELKPQEPLPKPEETTLEEIKRGRREGLSNREILTLHPEITLNQLKYGVRKLLARGEIKKRKQTQEELEEFDQKVRTLIEEGLTNRTIAEEHFKAPISWVESAARRLIKKGKIESRVRPRRPPAERLEFKQKIKCLVLVNEDLKNKEILKRLPGEGVTRYIVQKLVSELVEEGEISKRKKRAPNPEILARDQKVKNLREEGLANPKIVERLGISESKVHDSVSRLIERGEIESRKRKGKGIAYYSLLKFAVEKHLENPDQSLVLNQTELGKLCGVSSERVRQLLKDIRNVHPELKILLPKEAKAKPS